MRRARGPHVRRKTGAIVTCSTAPPPARLTRCLDQLGPESAKSFPGQPLVRAGPPDADQPAERATQEIDSGRRGKGDLFGAFQPATGEAVTAPDRGRTIVNWVDCLGQVEAGIPPEVERVHAIVDTLTVHRATDGLLFSRAHPRWEFVVQPPDAASLTLIEPWWKILRSRARKGRRFETGGQITAAVAEATASWHAHRHPFVWGRRRRHTPRRQTGAARLPRVA